MLKSFDRVLSEFTPVYLRRGREPCVKVGVLLGSQTFIFIAETAEHPKNFCQVRMRTDIHWHRNQDQKEAISMNWLTFHNGGIVVQKRPVDKELNRRPLLHKRSGIISINIDT